MFKGEPNADAVFLLWFGSARGCHGNERSAFECQEAICIQIICKIKPD